MSSKAYIVPVDPQHPAGNAAPGVNPATLWSSLPQAQKPAKVGTSHLFYGTPALDVTALVSLGEGFDSKSGDARREIVRKAVGSGVKSVKGLGDGVSEAPSLLTWRYTTLRSKRRLRRRSTLGAQAGVPKKLNISTNISSADWDRGVIYADAQNFARTLMEMPANMMTPTAFCEHVKAKFSGIPDVEIIVRDEAWAADKGMRTFLSVTQGTDQPAKFLEIHYRGAPSKDAQPLAFVGKGITFDSGGISLKSSAGMKLMRGDMGGAAAVVSSLFASRQAPTPVRCCCLRSTLTLIYPNCRINVVAVTPLCENLPGPKATKPGDVIYAMNGKSVEVDNTDAEGRLVLADALYYASTEFKPHTVIDVATLTGAMDTALGEIYTGVFTTSDTLWNRLSAAGESEYDRFWRMPLDEDYGPQIYSSNADLCNTGGRPAGACTAALFLKAFVDGLEGKDGQEPSVRWAHIDIAGTMEFTRPVPYQEKGMTGRPVRALVEFVRRLSSQG
ncbi:cytosol aminopeptidase family, catalytic domain-containing protein [Suillus ampliporus]|nr:cytosol aminopeptidase family, catalytic domain-containing protein [Suillus ampliporus]